MNENLAIFMNKIADDEEFAEKIQAVNTPEEAYALALTVQDGYTQEEFVELMQQINAAANDELNIDDLRDVAGGLSPQTENMIIWGASATVAAGAGAIIGTCVFSSGCAV